MMKRLNFWSRKFFRRAVQQISSRVYVNPETDLHKSILVAGTVRSGTTWLGDLIAAQISCRVMFEPFNPELVPEYSGFNHFQYLRPGCDYKAFFAFAHRVLTGDIRNRWIDRYNERIFPQYRLIKEVRANLALKWLSENFPQVPIIFLMRHPCAVVSSRLELGWATDKDIRQFLRQPDLVADYLADYLDLIHEVRTDAEKHAIIWSITNLVPLRQFKPGALTMVYYEDLCTQPEAQLSSILASIEKKPRNLHPAIINRPSQTARETSAIVKGTDRITSWKKRLSSAQIDSILRVVDAFHLDYLYCDSVRPVKP